MFARQWHTNGNDKKGPCCAKHGLEWVGQGPKWTRVLLEIVVNWLSEPAGKVFIVPKKKPVHCDIVFGIRRAKHDCTGGSSHLCELHAIIVLDVWTHPIV